MPFCAVCGRQGEGTHCLSCATPLPKITLRPNQRTDSPTESGGASVSSGKIGGFVGAALAVLVGIGALSRMMANTSFSPTSFLGQSQLSAQPEAVSKILSGGTNCNPSDFKIIGERGTMDSDVGYMYFTGTIINNCSESAGVEVKITAYDSSGTVLDTTDEWPASTSNIAPGSHYPFKSMMTLQAGMKKFSITPISVQRW